MAGKDRKKELARQRYERQQARRRAQQARARRIRIIGAVIVVAVVAGGAAGVVAVTRGDDKPGAAQAKEASCTYTPVPGEQGAPKGLGTPASEPQHRGPVKATIKTNQGDVELELDGAKAPCTTNSFVFLAAKKFFDKTKCHRLSTSEGLRMLQCGDPTGTGKGGPGYRYDDENLEGATYPKGTVAMANSGEDTNGSQFFLVYGDSQLDPNYSVFGKITKGLDVLEKIGKAGIDGEGTDGAPKKKVTIQSVSIAGN